MYVNMHIRTYILNIRSHMYMTYIYPANRYSRFIRIFFCELIKVKDTIDTNRAGKNKSYTEFEKVLHNNVGLERALTLLLITTASILYYTIHTLSLK